MSTDFDVPVEDTEDPGYEYGACIRCLTPKPSPGSADLCANCDHELGMVVLGHDIYLPEVRSLAVELQELRASAAAVVAAMKAAAVVNPTLTALEALLPPVSTLAIRFEG